jgi:Peptidase family M23
LELLVNKKWLMKKIITSILILSPILLLGQTLQVTQPSKMSKCVTPADQAAFDQRIIQKRAAFKAYRTAHPELYPEFNSNNITTTHNHVLFNWPMRVKSEYDAVYSYFNQENFVDQEPSIDPDGDDDNREDPFIEDYRCNNRTYDEHRGQDINLFPFWWRMMDNNYVMAVAAAPGVIIDKDDGNFDKNCSCIEPPNRVTIEHADGTVSSYWHLKKNSLTTKPVLATVETGEFLGFIGSSGCSSWPHLHFEVKDSLNQRVEPYFTAGQCNTMNDDSWWVNQRPYWDPGIARIMTHSGIPSLERCSDDEVVLAKNQFSSGDLVYIGTALVDGQDGDVINLEVTRPDGTLTNAWNINVTSTKARDYPLRVFLLPSGNTGTWTVRATYRSKVYSHYFTVGCKDNEVLSGSLSGNHGFITGNYITTSVSHSGASNTRILYQAANQIEFKPGFQASGSSGLTMKARLKSCTYAE